LDGQLFLNQKMPQKILVIGGTGMLGKPVAVQFKKDGFDVTVFSRNANDARIIMPTSFSFAQGDVSDLASLENAMEGMFAVHINLSGAPFVSQMEKVEYQGVKNIVAAAKKKNVQKITMISGASVSEANTWYKPTKIKWMAENEIIGSGIPYVIFRPSWFMESLPKMIKNGRAIAPANLSKEFYWVAARDYAQLVSKAMMTHVANNKIMPVAGPEKFTFADALHNYCRLSHPGVKVQAVSTALMRIIGTVTFNPELKMVAALFAYFSKVNEQVGMDETRKLLGQPLTKLEAWAVDPVASL
jgi:uncharacterized protein YbjT (DUF2867 family)